MLKSSLSLVWMSGYAGKYGMSMLQCYAEINQHVVSTVPVAKARPAGSRGMLFQNAAQDLCTNPKDFLQGKYKSLWWPNGIADWKQRFAADVDALFNNGVKLEYAVFDMENGINTWTLDQASLNAIYADPRYQQLVATGNFPADCRNMNEAQRMQFNYGSAILTNAAIQQAIVGPLYARYPNLPWSNWMDCPITKADAASAMDLNGHAQYSARSGAPVYSPVFYGIMGGIQNLNPVFKLQWGCVALSNNTVRAGYRAHPGCKIMPWLAPRSESNFLDQAHWQELIYHMLVLCGPQVLYFNASDFTTLGNWKFDNSVAQFVAQTKGSAWKSCLTTDLTDYQNATVEVSACRVASGLTVGRATFKPNVTTATVKVAGKSITLTKPANSVGLWFRF